MRKEGIVAGDQSRVVTAADPSRTHADIVKIEGESYRLRESQVDATTRSKSRRDKKPPPNLTRRRCPL